MHFYEFIYLYYILWYRNAFLLLKIFILFIFYIGNILISFYFLTGFCINKQAEKKN